MQSIKSSFYTNIELGNYNKVQLLLNSGLDITSKTGEWALFLALKNNKFEIANLLVRNGATIRQSGIKKAKQLYLDSISKTFNSNQAIRYAV